MSLSTPGTPVEARNHHDAPESGMKQRLSRWAHGALDPIAGALTGLGIRADHLTIAGFVLSIVAGLLFFEGRFQAAALVMALAGICDILDGQLARRSGHVTRFGAFLDSTLDRVSEAMVLFGIAGFYVANLLELVQNPARALVEMSRGLEPATWAVLAMTATLALVGSFMVSYTRARAEGLGLECKVGWFERPERMVLLLVAALFGVGPVMSAALMTLVLMSFVTAIQRVAHVWKITRGSPGRSGDQNG